MTRPAAFRWAWWLLLLPWCAANTAYSVHNTIQAYTHHHPTLGLIDATGAAVSATCTLIVYDWRPWHRRHR